MFEDIGKFFEIVPNDTGKGGFYFHDDNAVSHLDKIINSHHHKK